MDSPQTPLPPRLRLLPADRSDRGSQRLRLGPVLMRSLGLGLGSPVLVQLPRGGEALCSAWPRPDRAEGFLQPDLKVCSPGLVLQTPTDQNHLDHLDPDRLRPVLSCPRLKAVRVTVLVQTDGFRKLAPPGLVHELVRDLLRGATVVQNFLVDLQDQDSEIRMVVIEDIAPGPGPGSGSGSGPGPGSDSGPGPGPDPGPGSGSGPGPGPGPGLRCGLVSSRTAVEVVSVQTLSRYRSRLQNQNQDRSPLGGLEEVSSLLMELLQLPLLYPLTLGSLGLPPPRGVLLVGPPGVGKTLLVHRVVGGAGAVLVLLRGPEVVSARPGESEEKLRAVFDRARRAAEEGPCVLFLDELDALCPRRTGSSAPENRLVAQLLTLMDGVHQSQRFLVVGATNRPDAIDPALRRPGRFDREVVLGAPTLQQRLSVLSSLCERLPVGPDVDVQQLALRTSGYVAADLSAVCREAAMNAVRERAKGGGGKQQLVTTSHFLEALKLVQPSCLRSAVGRTELRAVSWEQIGGLEPVKLRLRQSIEWPLRFPEAFLRLGLTRPRGVLLYGPPGCAKTTLVRAAAAASGCSFLSVSGADIYSPYVGDSETALAQLFRQARACAPCVLFLDEIDSLIGSRSHGGGGVHTRLLSVLLNEMDGVGLKTLERRGTTGTERTERMERTALQMETGTEQSGVTQQQVEEQQEVCNRDVMVVAATNRPDCLDSALLRPGRLDHVVYVPPPDQQARLSVLRVCTRSMPLHDDVHLEQLAEQTERYSGADLENLCKEAALLALQEEDNMAASVIRHSHFLRSLRESNPSLSEQQILRYQTFIT